MRTITTAVSRDHIIDLIKEDFYRHAFAKDNILDLKGIDIIPEMIPLEVIFQKEKEVLVTKGNG